MEIIRVKTKKQKREYIKFYYNIYKGDENFCDMNLIFVKNFLYKKDEFAKRCKVLPIMIYDGNLPKLECMFIIDNTKEIKLSFVEFVWGSERYLKVLMILSQELMKKYDKEKTIIGVNGQISYGLGILTDKYNRKFEFNSNYNKYYYTMEMDKIFPIIKRAFSYEYDVNNSIKFFDKNLLDANYKKFNFRFFNKENFKDEMLIFGKLCHETLKNTPYYSKKTPYEMYELMKQTKPFFKSEDIVFVCDGNKEIGFIYTHPDYAELFNKGKLDYLSFFLRLSSKIPEKIIYNVIGVLPEYQRSGVAMNLIDFTISFRKKNFTKGVSSFILEDNVQSTALCSKMSTGINKEFHLYEIERKY